MRVGPQPRAAPAATTCARVRWGSSANLRMTGKTRRASSHLSSAHRRQLGGTAWVVHMTDTSVSKVIGALRSTRNVPCAIKRHNAARLACRSSGTAARTLPKVALCVDRAALSMSSAATASTGTRLRGNNRFALSSIGPRTLRSVAMRNTAPLSRAQCRAATNAGLSRPQFLRRSARYFTSMSSARSVRYRTRKSGVYRRLVAPWQKAKVIGWEVIEASGRRKLVRVTKSRSRALSCSVVPVGSGWKPMICERRLSGMRLNHPPVAYAPNTRLWHI